MKVFFILLLSNIALAGVNLNESGVKYYKQHGYVVSSNASDDVWFGDGTYPFLSAASALVTTGSSSNDTSAGTGCQSVRLEGLDSSYNYQTEVIATNGTSGVTSSGTYIRLNKAECVAVGTGGVNAGQISVAASSNPVGIIPLGEGSTKHAIFTAPNDSPGVFIPGWNATLSHSSDTLSLQMRKYGESWQDVEIANIQSGAGISSKISENWIPVPKKADVRVRVKAISSTAGGPIRSDVSLEVVQKP